MNLCCSGVLLVFCGIFFVYRCFCMVFVKIGFEGFVWSLGYVRGKSIYFEY